MSQSTFATTLDILALATASNTLVDSCKTLAMLAMVLQQFDQLSVRYEKLFSEEM